MGFLLQPQQVDTYLARIGLTERPMQDAAGLAAVHRAHLHTVPFENLDIHRGIKITLDPAHLYDKIVQRRRGGFCYELNGLFALLLSALGFNVKLFGAGTRSPDGSFSFERAHLLLCTSVGSARFLCDVGFGQSYLAPLPFAEGDYLRSEGRFSVQRDGAHVVYLERDAADGIRGGYRFLPIAQVLSDFIEACNWTQTSPDSHFVQNQICSRATPDGRLSLSRDKFIETRGDERREYPVPPQERPALLVEQFGFLPSEAAAG